MIKSLLFRNFKIIFYLISIYNFKMNYIDYELVRVQVDVILFYIN
jgi:hypothetical protein